MISEPVTALTDLVLGTFAIALAIRLKVAASRGAVLWSYGLFSTGVGALTGGAWHAFAKSFSPLVLVVLWKVTVAAIGVAALCVFCGSAVALTPRRVAKFLTVAAMSIVAVYAIWMAFHDEFVYVIMNYGVLMLGVLALHIARFRLAPRASAWIIAGIAIAVVAAAVQASGLDLHEHFNHNDLYHVIQMGSLYVLYRGAKELPISSP